MNILRKNSVVLPLLILIIAVSLYFAINQVYAANSNSVDFEASSNQYARIANDLGITNSPTTIELWYKPESTPSGATYNLVSKGDADTNVQYVLLYVDDGGTPKVKVYRRQGAVTTGIASWTTTLTNGTWYHLVLRYDGTDLKLYETTANGTHTERATVATSGDGTALITDVFTIGVEDENGTIAGYADGLIDDVRVWNTARTSTELDNNFQTELAGNEPGLVAYYKLNDDNFVDATSNGYNLAASGSPVFSTDIPFPVPSSPVLRIRKSATQTLSSDSTTDNDTELTLTLLANKEYIVDGVIFANSTSAQPDIKIAFTTPSGAVIDLAAVSVASSDTAFIQTSDVDTSNFPIQANKINAIQITGTVKMGSMGGDVHFQWAQNTSKATLTGVLRGSYLRAEEI